VEVMNKGATEMAQNKRNHGHENHLKCRRHRPMMPQTKC
jgi:hypothetical protein